MLQLQESSAAEIRPFHKVRAALQYLNPQNAPPYCVMYPRTDGGPQQNCSYSSIEVDILNARRVVFPPTLDGAGFELHDAPSEVSDLLDDACVRSQYYPELVELVLLATGGSEAVVFDHQVRRREPDRRALTFGRHELPFLGPVGRVHNDYTEASGQARLGLVLGTHAAAAVDRRFSIVNVWRPVGHPVYDTPLALCDARSVIQQDLVPTELRYPERVGEAYQVIHRATHRWAFFDHVSPQEAIVFKQYDSALNVARFTPHAAFDMPGVSFEVPFRTSIEARVLVLY